MKKNGIIVGALALVAAVLYFASMANYAFPGESAHLMALWQGLDASSTVEHPLMGLFARAFGGGNLLAPIAGVLAVSLVYLLAVRVLKSPLGGLVAAVVFMLTPAVRGAATHLEPRLFDAVWMMGVFALFIPYLKAKKTAFCYPILFGVLGAFAFCDSALFLTLLPGLVAGIVLVSLKRGGKFYAPLTIFAVVFLVAFLISRGSFGLELTPFLKETARELKDYVSAEGWILVLIFATVPFVVSLFSYRKAFVEKPNLVQWIFHGVMTFVSILAIATPLSPSSLLENQGLYPVATSAYVAWTAGYLATFWWHHRRQVVAVTVGIGYAFVVSFALLWNLFTFDGGRGAFADETARRILDDLGSRTWFVTDGTLDDHLRLVAAARGQELHLICLQRDLDSFYLNALAELVKEKNLGGSKNATLTLSLKTLGVLPFVQDWFAADPTAAEEVAIYGAPDLWYSAGRRPVPEFLFFGSDEAKAANWPEDEWKRFDVILEAPKGWGSYRAHEETDPVTAKRLSIRRHVGFVANNRGVWLQDHQKDEEAFRMYERVLGEIDRDNVCSLFNEIEMAGQRFAAALDKKAALEKQLKAIVEDKHRRYIIWRLGSYYGYVRNPDMFVRLGFAWARSGRPGDALVQIRRAIDFVPTEKRATLLNMMAALYANENDQVKSRRIYESVLARDANDHDALVGMMRLKLLDGDEAEALAYLERAIRVSPSESRRARMELAMVSMMKGDLLGAKDLIRKIIESDPKDVQALSMLSAVTLQQYDAAKDPAEKAKILKEIETVIIPEMERQASSPHDFYVLSAKAFVLLRQGDEKRREARAAFEMAMRANPGSTVTQDLVLGLDISLDDKERAEAHARDILRKNRNAPLANYVMGSLAIRRAAYQEAEAFLRKAVDAPQPNILAQNDLAEVLRRTNRAAEGEMIVRRALEKAPDFYILHETLGVVLMDQNKDLDQAEAEIRRALELSKQQGGVEDVRLFTSLARVQVLRGDKKAARGSIRRVEAKIAELTEFERKELEEVKKSAAR